MTAVLTIKLDNQTSGGLKGLEEQLLRTAETTADAAADTKVLTDAQKEQIKVIHEHRAAASQLMAQIGPDLIQMGKRIGEIGTAWYAARRGAILFAQSYSELRAQTAGLAGANQLLSVGASRALGILTKTGPAIGGMVAAYKLAQHTLESTGKRETGLKGYGFDGATEEQIQEFHKVTVAAQEMGVSVETVMQSMGKSIGDFGGEKWVEVETNLDRLGEAGDRLGFRLAHPFRESAAAAATLASQLKFDLGIGEWVDKEVTRWSDETIKNMDALGGGFISLVDQMRAAQAEEWEGAGGGDRYLNEVNQMRELSGLHSRLEQQREREKSHFAGLRIANAQLAGIRESAAEQQRLNSLKTLSEIDGEIARQRQLAGEQATNLDFNAERQKQFTQIVGTLELRKTEIIRQEAEKQKEIRSQAIEFAEAREKAAIERRARDEGAAIRSSIERYNKWAEEVRDAQKRANDFAREFANNANNSILENLIGRLEREGGHEEEAHRAKLELIQQEIDQRIAAAETIEGREQAFYDGLMRMQREQLQHQRAVITAEVDARKEAAAKALAIETKKRDDLRKAMQDAGFAEGQQMLRQIDPQKALMNQRGRAAADAARREVLNDPDNADLRQQALVDVAASRRLKAMQERAAREAERSARAGAYRDFRRGTVDPAEVAQAQNAAGQQMLQTMGQNGQLSQDTVRIAQENLQVSANQQGMLDQLQRQIQQLQGPVKSLLSHSAQQRQRAIKGGLGN